MYIRSSFFSATREVSRQACLNFLSSRRLFIARSGMKPSHILLAAFSSAIEMFSFFRMFGTSFLSQSAYLRSMIFGAWTMMTREPSFFAISIAASMSFCFELSRAWTATTGIFVSLESFAT